MLSTSFSERAEAQGMLQNLTANKQGFIISLVGDYMDSSLFNEFLESGDTLRVYKDDQLIFSSDKDRVLPLLEYIDQFASSHQHVTIIDKIMGNAAALLSVKANCDEVYSPLGSQLAIETLDKYGIKHHMMA